MRLTRLLMAMVFVLILTSSSFAQNGPYAATINVPEALVRSGPSDKPELYTTNKLRRGDTVQVVKELEGGWLAIAPPPNSFSWINTRFLQQIEKTANWVVVVPDDVRVPVLYGSSLRNEKPTVEGAKVQRSTQVVSIGKPLPSDDGLWMPIEPPPGEVRFIRAEMVTPQANGIQTIGAVTPQPTTNVPPPVQPVTGMVTNRQTSTAGFASPTGGTDPRWLQAQQAEQAGNPALAIQIYEELSRTARNTDFPLADQAANRAQFLRDQGRKPAPRQPVQTVAGNHAIPPANERLTPIPASLHASVGPSNSGGPCTPCHPAQTVSSSSGTAQRGWAGRLRRASLRISGVQTYALENSQGQLQMYVTPQPGIDLEPWVNRYVYLTGRIDYLGWPPTYRMQATHVTPVQ